MKELSTLRLQIDEIDRAMTELLVRRMDVSREIAKAKQSTALPVTDPAREALILSRAREAAAPYGEEGCRLMRLLMDLSKRRQALEAIPRISLIGMPGCGKTTVGRALSALIGYAFFDTDEEVTRLTGLTPQQLITGRGEAAFRLAETEALKSVLARDHAVIATGGGIVTRQENRELLARNTLPCLILRDTALLPTEGRPLSQSVSPEKLLRERGPCYEQLARVRVTNQTTPQDTAEAILSDLLS